MFASVVSGCQSIDEIIIDQQDYYDVVISEPNKIKFVAVGDTGKGNPGQYKVAGAIKDKCDKDGCDFVIVLGDNIYGSGVDDVNDPQFQTKFEEPYKDINLPFFMALGNHDYGGNGRGYEIQKSFYQVQYTEHSPRWTMPAHYYRFRGGGAAFFALDTNAQMFNVANQQRRDISKWIADADSVWKIAFGHHPYKSNGPHGNAGNYDGAPEEVSLISGKGVKDFAESVWCGKIDVYFSGHDHSRQWLNTGCEGTHLVVSGAGASTTTLPGNNSVLFQEASLGFLYVVIEGNKLSAQFINEEGIVDFEHTLKKQ